MAGPPGVDVQAAAPRVACVDGQLDRLAAAPDVHEDALHALLMKLVVVAKADDVAQQPGLVDLAGRRTLICRLPQSGWPVTRQLLFSRLLVSTSVTGVSPKVAVSSSGAGV